MSDLMVKSFGLEEKQRHILGALRYLLLAAVLATFVLVVTGNLVRVSGAAQGCSDWPTCFGQWTLPEGMAARVQFAHRGVPILAGLLVGSAAVIAGLRLRQAHWISRPLAVAAVLVLAQAWIGSLLVSEEAAASLNTLHLGLALATLGLAVTAMISSFLLHKAPGSEGAWALRSPFARLALWTAVAVFVLMASGAWVASSDAGAACNGWPLCSGGLPETGLGWLALGHRAITALATGLIAALFVSAWRSQRSQRLQLTAATAIFILFVGQVLTGAVMASRDFSPDLVGLHASSSVALWAMLVLLVVAVGFSARQPGEEREEAYESMGAVQRLRDFLALNKPLIVVLLLVTTYAGMVVGGRQLPSLALTFWTLLGGALAAGGSSALNQYIDRDLDGSMQRTAKRPLPAGRLLPAEGLAYGVGAVLLSFFVMAAFVNLLAALLSLVGMVYYVLLYSIWLKRLTVQNIVIGGGAGAIPPLVGWAAAAGSLNIPSLFLFAIVFLWTPPHFWALALVRRKDYARASIPMLPVVQGEHATRKQILIYTLELVALTLLMPVFKITGSVFLISALVLGTWLISVAWRLFRMGGNKIAWKMYRYSSMYLAFLFLALVLDVLL